MEWIKFKNKDKKSKNPGVTPEHVTFILSNLDVFTKDGIIDGLPAPSANDSEAKTDLELMKSLIYLPDYLDRKEWIAYNLYMFFGCVNALKAAVVNVCNENSCPQMDSLTVLQACFPGEKVRKSKTPAKLWLDKIIDTIEKEITDSKIYPTDPGAEFGDNFEASTSKLLTLFFVVILHLYLHHTTYFKNSGILNRLNQMTLHMVLFCDIFQYQKSYKFDETLVKIAEKIVTMF